MIAIVLSIVLIQIPNIVDANSPQRPLLKIITIIPFLLIPLFRYQISGLPQVNALKPLPFLCFIFVLAIIITNIRGYVVGAIELSEFLFNTILIISLWQFGVAANMRATSLDVFYRTASIALCWSIAAYLFLNIALYILGFHGEPRGNALLLGYFGIDTLRVKFLLSDGWNSFGVYSGASMTVGMLILTVKSKEPKYLLLGTICLLLGLFGILGVDSRGALLYSTLTFLLIRLCPRSLYSSLKFVPLAMPTSFLLLFPALKFLSTIDGLSYISRGSRDLSGENSRLLIWSEGINSIDLSSIYTYFGYGSRGNVTSGIASETFIDLFKIGAVGVDGERWMTMHNSYLQYQLDMGIVGVLLIALLTYKLLSKLVALHSQNGYVEYEFVIGLVIYYCLSAQTEVSMTMYHEGFILLAVTIFFYSHSSLGSVSKSVNLRTGNHHL